MGCPFEAKFATNDELMKKSEAYAASVYNMKTVSPEMMEKIQKAFKE